MLLAILCILTACSTYNGNDDKTKDETSTFSVFPNEVIDHAGRRVYIETEPQRIVSLAPSNTEIMFAIGLRWSPKFGQVVKSGFCSLK